MHEGLAPEVYDAIAGTARQLGMPFAGHVSDHVGLFRALEVGQATIDHLDNYVESLVPEEQESEEPPGLRGAHELLERIDEARIDLLVQKTLEADGSVVPTMVLWESGLYATRPSETLLERIVNFKPKDSQFQAALACPRRNYSPKDDLFSLGWRCRGYQSSLKRLARGDGASD